MKITTILTWALGISIVAAGLTHHGPLKHGAPDFSMLKTDCQRECGLSQLMNDSCARKTTDKAWKCMCQSKEYLSRGAMCVLKKCAEGELETYANTTASFCKPWRARTAKQIIVWGKDGVAKGEAWKIEY
ncbi:hypothetical protein NA57DRAFT_78011 [Rhizodiscina lignyota]|uniref:Extracellular membrane protein CFEM domain-containing protein n=1 Tax=Rhizodiscina lignyota TaxID=1504668 RepID=A0A9P4IBV0_9PEZI|nr:hypothetical protein NA57DRAFT_78011 [Rhizodiscina lignyota]